MFWRKKKETNIEADQNVGTINLGMSGYFGGLESNPNPEGINVFLHDDRIELCFMESNTTLEIPYINISNIEIINKTDFLSSLRAAIMFPIPDIVTYTKILYQENSTEHYVVIDFDKSLGFAFDFLNNKIREFNKDS